MPRITTILPDTDLGGPAPDIAQPQQPPARLTRDSIRSAPSLRPGVAVMEGCIRGDEDAIEIRNAWKFSFPVRPVSRVDFAALIERDEVVFHG